MTGFLKILALVIFAASARSEPIVRTEINYDPRLDKQSIKEVSDYLKRYVGQESKKSAHNAQDFLRRLFFIADATCETHAQILYCNIISKYRIQKISIDNLPASLLENEIMRKLPLEHGQYINFDEKSRSNLVDLTRSRVKTYLRKMGFYGSRVIISYTEFNDDLALDWNIKIEGGAFALVNRVMIEGQTPIKAKSIQRKYQSMCLSFKDFLNALSIWSFSCYSRELERETTDDLLERLARLGYVRARVRVQHDWLDPYDPKTPSRCQSARIYNNQSRCVDLRLEIDQGPRVRWAIRMLDNKSTSKNDLARFMGSVLATDAISRLTLDDYSEDVPEDQVIIKKELEAQINFIEAKNIDEQELNISAERMTKYLVKKGYTNAQVIASSVQEDPDNILVNFDVYTNNNFYIRSVSVEPKYFNNFISQDSLENTVKVRSFLASGYLSYPEIELAKIELERQLNEKGFSGVKSVVEMTNAGAGAVDIIFRFSTNPRMLVQSLEIINGIDEINNQIIPTLKNCDNYKNSTHCEGSSFLPDQISTDETRITDFYQANDYVYAQVRSELVQKNNSNKLIFYVYDSRFAHQKDKELKQQTVNNLIISGNASTSERVIRRLFPRSSHNLFYDSLSLKKGLANLRESGRFLRPEHKLIAAQPKSDNLYFLLQVIERQSLSLDASLGFSTDQLLSIEAELEENNLFSSMLTLKTKLSLGLFWGRQSSINNKLIWPFIGGKPFIFTLHAPIIVYDDKTHRPEPFRRVQSKIVAGLDWRASVNLLPSIKYYFVYTQEDREARRLSLSEKFNTLDGLLTTFKKPGKLSSVLKPGISYINLDNPFDPHKGVDLDNWIEINAGPFENIMPFVNIGTQNRFYIPLGPCTLVLQASFMRTFIKPSDKNFQQLKNISSMDKLGGDRSVRGYKEGSLGITKSAGILRPLSGYFANVANLEFRFPLTQSGMWNNFSGALFVDQASLLACDDLLSCSKGKSFKQIINERGFGLSVGAGLRYHLPVGPILLDYGVSPIHGDSRVHLLFGYAF